MASWLTSILNTVKGRSTKEEVEVDLKALGGIAVIPCTVEFDYTCTVASRGGLVFWAYEKTWTGCKKAIGFELGLSQSRLRICNASGKLVTDTRFRMPAEEGTRAKFRVIISLEKDRAICTISPERMPVTSGVQVQSLLPLPSRLLIGTGDPPGPGNGVVGASVDNFKITR